MSEEFFDFSKEEIKLIESINTPKKMQDFINSLKANFEENGETCQSPKTVLKTGKAHCMEGAMLSACLLRYHGFPPLIVDIESTKKDFDHVIAVFKVDGFWGAISKTNHSVLRYREPVYKSIRELVMSYFHEYFNDDGIKTMRAYSSPIDLSKFDKLNWMSSTDEVWFVPDYLTKIPHKKILTKKQIFNLRKADKIEIETGKIVEYKK